MKVVFVIDGLGTGGAERSLLELLPALERAHVDVTIACLHRRAEGVETEIVTRGTDVRFLPAGPVSALRALRRFLREASPDVVHTTILASTLLGRFASIGRDLTVLTSLVNTPYASIRREDPRLRPLALSAVKAVDRVTGRLLTDHFHAITEAVKAQAVADLRIDPDKITVIHRGRDPERLGAPSPERRRAARRGLGLEPQDEVVVSVGRQEYQKGQSDLLRAIVLLARQRPRLQLLVAGRTGASTAELERLHQASGLDGRIRFLGHRDDVPDVLAAADVFAFPSLFEGFGGSLIEAMALGLPIVGSDLPAVREVVEAGRNAVLVPVRSPDALAGAIDDVLGDREMARSFGRRGREVYLERYTSAKSAEAMLHLYERLARSHRPAVWTGSR